MATGFWTSDAYHDIALQYRFRVMITGTSLPEDFVWYAKAIDKPQVDIAALAKGEFYLGSRLPDTRPAEIATFQPLTMTLVNPVQPNATEELLKVLQAGTDTTTGGFPRIAGFKLKKGVEVVRIEQIDRDGKVIDWFELKGAFPTNINFGRLDYSSDTPVELSITWEYTAFNAGARETTILDSGYRSTEVSGMDCAIGLDGTMT